MCGHIQSCKLVHVSGVQYHRGASSTSSCTSKYSTVHNCIEYTIKLRMSGSKHKSRGDVTYTAKKCQVITMETKVKIIERMKWGKKMVDIAHSYNMNHSTISTILRNKDKIKEHMKSAVLIMLTIISKKHGKSRQWRNFSCGCRISIRVESCSD